MFHLFSSLNIIYASQKIICQITIDNFQLRRTVIPVQRLLSRAKKLIQRGSFFFFFFFFYATFMKKHTVEITQTDSMQLNRTKTS